ncbi:MAG: PilZ domain-containing protein [Gammaproteobacteria bacterium]|nr:PilZ domain-containing protein [Gammaproteobacteria bacterium]
MMMADTPIDRRKFQRRMIRLACHLQLNAGQLVHGYTQNISRDGVFLEAQSLPAHLQHLRPKAGDVGMLILQYKKNGAPGTLKVGCRVMHAMANGIGVNIFISKLSLSDQQTITMILESESGAL